MLTPVSYYYMTSFNYGGKKARDVDLTCRCHQNDVIPSSIFYDTMGWGMTWVFSLGVVIAVFLSIEEIDSVLSL